MHFPVAAQRRSFLRLLSHALIVLLIAIGGLVLRATNIRKFTAGYDEQITRAVVSNIWRGDLRNNWKYAADIPAPFKIDCYNFSSYMYADALFVGRPNRKSLYFDRWFSAATGTIAIFLFYLVALQLFGPAVALISLGAMAVCPLLVQDAHYARPEGFALLLCAIVYLSALGVLDSRLRIGFLATSSFFCGLLIACKYSMIPMVLIPLICLVARKGVGLRSIATWVSGTIAGVFIGVPDAFIHPDAFWNGVQMLRTQYSTYHPPHGLVDGSRVFPLCAAYFWQTLGPLFCILCVAGIVLLARRREYFRIAIIGGPVVFYFAFFSFQRVFFERNLSHVVPLAAILSGFGLVVLSSAFRSGARVLVFALLLAIVLIWPARISAKLVYVAIPSPFEQRTNEYEALLSKTGKLTVNAAGDLLSIGQVRDFEKRAIASPHGILARITDFHDSYTGKFLPLLKKCTDGQEVGYLASLFPSLSVNTIITYHAPAFHYIQLNPPPKLQLGGYTFIPWAQAAAPLSPAAIRLDSWAENGVYPLLETPNGKDRFFGSYLSGSGDANRGSIHMGPFDVAGLSQIAIPVITGPVSAALSVSVVDHETGAVAIQMSPPPVLPNWTAWRINVAKIHSGKIDIVAKDDGVGWGQWLGVGLPLRLAESGFQNETQERPKAVR